MRRILLLVDGIHTAELVAELDRVSGLRDADLMLVYVHGRGPRHGLEIVRHRPGGVGLPPHRRRDIAEAEQARATAALEEAEARARPLAAHVRTLELEGDAGHRVVEMARERRADLVAVRVTGGRTGPAATFISDHAPCSVVLLRLER